MPTPSGSDNAKVSESIGIAPGVAADDSASVTESISLATSINVSDSVTESEHIANGRITQSGLEVVIRASPNARVTHNGLEVVVKTNPQARFTQDGLEVITRGTPKARLTQMGLEVVAIPGGLRTVPVIGVFVANGRWIPTKGILIGGGGRAIQLQAYFGPSRPIPIYGRFSGVAARRVPIWAEFHQPGLVPITASFWKPQAPGGTWSFQSNSNSLSFLSDGTVSKVMSLGSHLIGGGIHSYLGFPEITAAPLPAGWEQPYPTYDDTFWPRGRDNGIIPGFDPT